MNRLRAVASSASAVFRRNVHWPSSARYGYRRSPVVPTRAFHFLLALLVVSLGCVSAPTAAQSAGNLPAETPGPQPTANATDTTRIDGQTEIVGSEYLPDEGIARITLRSSAVQTVTISDAGRFQEGGKIPVRTVAMRSDDTATVEIPVTEKDGYVGVAISTANTPLYAEIVNGPPVAGSKSPRTLIVASWPTEGRLRRFHRYLIVTLDSGTLRGENGLSEVAVGLAATFQNNRDRLVYLLAGTSY